MTRMVATRWMAGAAAMVAVAMVWASASAESVFVVQVDEGPGEVFDVPEADIEVQAEDVLAVEPVPPAAGPAGGFLGLGFRAMFNAIAPVPVPQSRQQPIPVDEGEDGEMPKDPRAQQQWQQRKQIRQQAKHLEQLFQPVLRTELEMIRQACPDLSVDGRREVLAAGRTAVTKTALEFATRQMLGGQPRRAFDARKGIQTPMARALEPHATEAELETYARQQETRRERRAKAARVAIVAKLDRQLDLSAAQRTAIEDDLVARWDDAWLRELDDTGMVINNFRPAPDYANACIEPHLDDHQLGEWQRWRQAAGMAVVGMHVGWNFDGQGLHQEDDWWTKEGTP
jgi:hypothetical protein